MKRKPKIIEDKKRRGEWAESVFVARAGEHGLPVSKPWGDSNSFDCVVGRPGKFVGVQVKSTVTKLESGKGYTCSTCSSHKVYRAGAFDFLAAYVIPEDAWYIIPAREMHGRKSISLCTYGGEEKYEKYREAWHLLCEASESEEQSSAEESEESAGGEDKDSAEQSGVPEKSGEGKTSNSAEAPASGSVEVTPRHENPTVERYIESANLWMRRMGIERLKREGKI